MKWLKPTGQFLLFLVLMISMAGALRLLNWVPLVVGDRGGRSFASIEEMRHSLPIRELWLPAYVPDYLQWPPSEIYGQRKPRRMTLMHLSESPGERIAVAISQVEAGAAETFPSRISPTRIRQTRSVSLGGQPATLLLGDCRQGDPCNEISWVQGGWRLTVAARGPSEELLRIAGSMSLHSAP